MSTHSNNSQQNAEQLPSRDGEQDFYVTSELSQRLDLIQHLVGNSELIPLMRGEAGVGKSTAVCQLQAQASDSWLFCRIDANPMLHPDQLMLRLARFFGVPDADDNIRERLIRYFESIRDEGRLAVIIIDDAEQLPPASLIALLRLHEQYLGKMPIVALVLFALPTIDRILATPQLQVMNLQQFHILDMPLLSREHVPGYLELLLEQEGLADQLSLAEPKIDTLFCMSGGLPGKLTPLILQSINESVPIGRSQKKRYSSGVMIALAGALLVVVLMLLFQDKINQLFSADTPNQQLLPLPDQGSLVQKKELLQEIPIKQDLAEDSGQAIALIAGEASQQESMAEVEPVEVTPTEVTPTEVTPTEVTPTEVTPTEVTPTEVTPTEVTPTEVVSERELYQKIEIPIVPVARDESDGVKWVKRHAPSHFTLQLIGVSELKSIGKFIQEYALKGELFHIKMIRKEAPWYILLSGSYPDRETAKAAIFQDLPRSLQKRGVWARSFGSIQQELE